MYVLCCVALDICSKKKNIREKKKEKANHIKITVKIRNDSGKVLRLVQYIFVMQKYKLISKEWLWLNKRDTTNHSFWKTQSLISNVKWQNIKILSNAVNYWKIKASFQLLYPPNVLSLKTFEWHLIIWKYLCTIAYIDFVIKFIQCTKFHKLKWLNTEYTEYSRQFTIWRFHESLNLLQATQWSNAS